MIGYSNNIVKFNSIKSHVSRNLKCKNDMFWLRNKSNVGWNLIFRKSDVSTTHDRKWFRRKSFLSSILHAVQQSKSGTRQKFKYLRCSKQIGTIIRHSRTFYRNWINKPAHDMNWKNLLRLVEELGCFSKVLNKILNCGIFMANMRTFCRTFVSVQIESWVRCTFWVSWSGCYWSFCCRSDWFWWMDSHNVDRRKCCHHHGHAVSRFDI